MENFHQKYPKKENLEKFGLLARIGPKAVNGYRASMEPGGFLL
jgi:hypothetical protein